MAQRTAWKKRMEVCLKQAENGHWNSVPIVRMKLRLAINSLVDQVPNIKSWTPDQMAQVIKQPKNKGVRDILRKHTDEQIAFAIYDARYRNDTE